MCLRKAGNRKQDLRRNLSGDTEEDFIAEELCVHTKEFVITFVWIQYFNSGFAHDVRRKANPESGVFLCVCESTEQRRLAQSKGLRKLPDGENGACWTYREGTEQTEIHKVHPCQHPSDVAGDGEIDKEIQVEERNPEEGKRVLIGEKTSLTRQSTSPGRSEKELRGEKSFSVSIVEYGLGLPPKQAQTPWLVRFSIKEHQILREVNAASGQSGGVNRHV
ncbi:hypothetical protein E5288_WYG014404 [Bos mutus]|uniref:Uncharacterized protein n=1 Tax=Bos mutus TaxID=72004 RepID=A0A6B0RCX6_9CETA|nr:hypothetical protein [Bos mutus]